MTLDEALTLLEQISPQAARVVRRELERGYNGAMVDDLRLAASTLRYSDNGKRYYADVLADRLSRYAAELVEQ